MQLENLTEMWQHNISFSALERAVGGATAVVLAQLRFYYTTFQCSRASRRGCNIAEAHGMEKPCEPFSALERAVGGATMGAVPGERVDGHNPFSALERAVGGATMTLPPFNAYSPH